MAHYLTDGEISDNWNRLGTLSGTTYSQIMDYFAEDAQIQGKDGMLTVLGFKNAPAGKGVHHAYRGGLVEHLLEGLDYLDNLHKEFPQTDYFDMKTAWLLHDLHKAFYHFSIDGAGKINYLDHALTKMYTPNQKTFMMIDGSLEPAAPAMIVNPNVVHIVNCSEGGWAENPPAQSSVEAKIVYLIDELSVIKNRIKCNKMHSIYPQDESWTTFWGDKCVV